MQMHAAAITQVLSIVESAVKIAAVLFAGAWAYYHYFRGRTYKSRLELVVTGEVVNHQQTDYIIATLHMKNVGLSRVEIVQRGTGLRVSTCDAPTEPYSDIHWEVGRVFPTFVHHECIEPGEPIEDRAIVALPSGKMAVRLEFRVVSGNMEWNTEEIVSGVTKSQLKGG